MKSSLDPLFQPRSIALIGASRDPRSMSGALLRNLRESFRGPIYAVNSRAAAAGTLDVYASLTAAPSEVDLAIVAVPAAAAVDVVRECVAKPVRAVLMITAGFDELGPAGAEASVEIRRLIQAAGIPLLGPNCLGLFSTDPDRPINASFGPSAPPHGTIAVAAQSGALGFVLVEMFRRRGQGVARFVSLGNKLVCNECDFLEHWLDAPDQRAVALYLESLADPRRLLEVGRRLSKLRPVVLLKSGRTEAGERAAGSHTAALATPRRLAEGLARQAGFLRVESLEELAETALLCARQAPPGGRRAAVVTNAGGPGVMLADSLAEQGWTLPPPSPQLAADLRSFVPALASIGNPVDLVGSIDAELFGRCFERLVASQEYDAITAIYVPRLAGTSEAIARALGRVARAAPVDKSLAVVLMESEAEVGRLQAECAPAACFEFPERAAAALTRAAEYAAWRAPPPCDLESLRPAPWSSARISAVRRTVEQACATILGRAAASDTEGDTAGGPSSGGWMEFDRLAELLEQAELSAVEQRRAESVDEAVEAAGRFGWPVVLKAIAPQLVHKAAAGGVLLDLRNPDELRAAWATLERRVPDFSAGLVQPYRPARRELLVGVRKAAGFGHVVALGAGGVDVERRGEAEFRLLPLDRNDAWELVATVLRPSGSTAAGGPSQAVGPEPGPLERRLVQWLLRLSELMDQAPEIEELDLNPVAVYDDPDRPLLALDARCFVRGSRGAGGRGRGPVEP